MANFYEPDFVSTAPGTGFGTTSRQSAGAAGELEASGGDIIPLWKQLGYASFAEWMDLGQPATPKQQFTETTRDVARDVASQVKSTTAGAFATVESGVAAQRQLREQGLAELEMGEAALAATPPRQSFATAPEETLRAQLQEGREGRSVSPIKPVTDFGEAAVQAVREPLLDLAEVAGPSVPGVGPALEIVAGGARAAGADVSAGDLARLGADLVLPQNLKEVLIELTPVGFAGDIADLRRLGSTYEKLPELSRRTRAALDAGTKVDEGLIVGRGAGQLIPGVSSRAEIGIRGGDRLDEIADMVESLETAAEQVAFLKTLDPSDLMEYEMVLRRANPEQADEIKAAITATMNEERRLAEEIRKAEFQRAVDPGPVDGAVDPNATKRLTPPEPKLPKELSGAKPSFNPGGSKKPDKLNFVSDLDRAAYIIRNGKTKSKRDKEYLAFVRSALGDVTEAEARAYGDRVLAAVKNAPVSGGARRIPSVRAQAAKATNDVIEQSKASGRVLGKNAGQEPPKPPETKAGDGGGGGSGDGTPPGGADAAGDAGGGGAARGLTDPKNEFDDSGSAQFLIGEKLTKNEPINIGDELLAILGAPRLMKATMDWSAPGRQGLALAVRHPVEWLQSWGPMIRAWKTEAGAALVQKEVDELMKPWRRMLSQKPGGLNFDPNAPIEDLMNFYGTGIDALNRVPGFDAHYKNSKIAAAIQKIPGIGRSERAYAAFLNLQKAKTFNTMASAMMNAQDMNPIQRLVRGVSNEPATIEQLQALGRLLDHATGFGAAPLRTGDVGRLAGQTFFSQRFMASRFQFLADPIVEGIKARDLLTSRRAAENLVAFYGGQLGLLMLMDDIGLVEANLNPTSGDFLKFRIGPLRLDAGAGITPIIRTAARIKEGSLQTFSGESFDIDPKTEAFGFFQNKLAPIPSEILRRVTLDERGFDRFDERPPNPLSIFSGSPEGLGQFLYEMFTPLVVDSVIEAFKEGGLESALIAGPSEFVGVGASTYGNVKIKQNELAQERFGVPWHQMSAAGMAEINHDLLAAGVDVPDERRDDPWWKARDWAFWKWQQGLSEVEQQDPIVMRLLFSSRYSEAYNETEFTPIVEWLVNEHGWSREKALRQINLRLDHLGTESFNEIRDKMRLEALSADPGIIGAMARMNNADIIDFLPGRKYAEAIAPFYGIDPESEDLFKELAEVSP